jgi:two-component system NtrC family sensor kinase
VRPLKLHLKTTLILSAVVMVVFSLVAFVYTRQVVGLEHKQYAERAQQLATYYADQWAARWTLASTPPGESQRELLRGYGFDLNLYQVFQFYTDRAGQPAAGTISLRTDTNAPEHVLAPNDVMDLVAHDFPEPEVTEHPDGRFTVWAVAPIIYNDRTSQSVVGAVGVEIEVPAGKSLAWKMTRMTIFAMAIIVIGIAVVTYLLFKRLVYDPVDSLLSGMTRAESGDLSVAVPPRALDELGLLTVRFNHMVGRLRELAEERAAHARQLEERVRDATHELAGSNDQLVRKNIELFGIQRQLGQLERLAAAGQLAAQFAHEVGTPLNLISGHVQLLRAKETDERTIKRLETIAAQIARIERIVRGMLDQTRRPTARLEPLDLGALLGRLFDTIAPTLASKDVDLVAEIEPDLPSVLADSDQLQQVFINLVNNSLDAMPDGGTLAVGARAVGDEVRVEVADTGVGIAEDDLPHLFEPLFTTKERGKGSGFGLAVAQQIVREHGGRIEAASGPAGGATFIIFLPLATEAGGASEIDIEDGATVPLDEPR